MLEPERAIEEIARLTDRDRALIAAHGGRDMAETGDKLAALVDATKALATSGAGHALVGGVAVGIHSGMPRATAGTDVAVASTADRAAVIAALLAAGFRLTGEFRHSVNFRHRSGEPVQLVFDPAFDPMIARAEAVDVLGVSVPLVRKADLIAMKELAAEDAPRPDLYAKRDRAVSAASGARITSPCGRGRPCLGVTAQGATI